MTTAPDTRSFLSPWTPNARDWWLFAGLAALLVTVRLFLIVTGGLHPNQGGDLPEALITGRGAFDVLNGTWRGWRVYLYYPGGHFGNEMGGTIFTLPLFWLAGPSLIAIALMPMILAVTAAAAMFRLSRSRNAAFVTVIYFVFMPLDVQSWHLYPYLTHVETMVWFVFALWILRPILLGAAARASRLFAAGWVIGFGLFMCDLEVLALPALAVTWYVAKIPLPSRRAMLAGVSGLIVAALPYLVFVIVKPDAIGYFYSTLGTNAGLTDPLAYVRPIALPSAVVWPFAGLASTPGARLVLGMAVTAGLCWWGRRLHRSAQPHAADVAMFAIAAGFCLMNVLTRNAVQYYLYALAAPFAFIAGGVFAELTARWTPARCRTAITAIAVAGLLMTGSGLWSAQAGVSADAVRSARIARGYSFYWPEPYPVFSGYKTPLGEEVERFAARTQFSTEPAPVPARREKFFAIAPGDVAWHPLESREDYFLFGIDVTSVGIARLAGQVVQEVERHHWPEAFGGIAVFAANDFLLSELVEMFADSTIDRAVPDCCVDVFYQELGRKIRDQSAQATVGEFLNGLTAAQRQAVERGLTGSRFVDYQIDKWPARRRR